MIETRKALLLLLVPLLILTGIVGCSSKNAECKVTLDREGKLDIIVNPPGESQEAKQDGTLKRNMQISPSGSTTTYEGELDKTYPASGNTYNVKVFIKIADDRLLDYKLEVTGGVYKDTPHICQK